MQTLLQVLFFLLLLLLLTLLLLLLLHSVSEEIILLTSVAISFTAPTFYHVSQSPPPQVLQGCSRSPMPYQQVNDVQGEGGKIQAEVSLCQEGGLGGASQGENQSMGL